VVEALTHALRRLPLLLAMVAAPCAAPAHRLDEYLQATLVVIERDAVRLQIHLTPGVAVAERVLAHIDRNADGAISGDEATAYADSLKRDLTLRVDAREADLTLIGSHCPEPIALRTGEGIIQIELQATIGPLAAGAHILTLENRHLTSLSAYLLNAAKPTTRTVQITRQRRTDNQSSGTIEFGIRVSPDVD
jgi:hypothetical protein